MKKLSLVLSLLLMTSCSSNRTVISSNENSSNKETEKPKETTVSTSTPSATTEAKESIIKDIQNTNDQNVARSIYGAMSWSLPEGWEIIATGVDNPYGDMSTDYIGAMCGNKRVEVTCLMRAPAGIGWDPMYDEMIDDVKIGDYTFMGGINNGTDMTLGSEHVFDDPEHALLFVYYSCEDGVSVDDSDLRELISSLEVQDSYGTIEILADSVNIRNLESTDGDKVGVAKKGEKYKVYSVLGATEYSEYTWYNVGDEQFIADNGEWVKFNAIK